MPRSKTPCGARYALVFRYITDALVREDAIKTAVAFRLLDKQGKMERKQRNIERNAEYEAVQAAYTQGGYAAVEQCLRLKPWTSAVVTPAVRERGVFGEHEKLEAV